MKSPLPSSGQVFDVLVVGGGISGLAAARKISETGRTVAVVDKGRSVSGRAATRQWGEMRVDHGAQFFTARSEAFLKQVKYWLEKDICFEWTRGIHEWNGSRLVPPSDGVHPRFACRTGMSALGKALAAGLNVTSGARVASVASESGRWRIVLEGSKEEFSAATLVLSAPVPQSIALLGGQFNGLTSEARSALSAVEYGPSLCVALQCDVPAPDWKGIQVRVPHMLSWIADDSSRRQAGLDGPRTIVLHASSQFSREWQDKDLEQAAGQMISAAADIAGGWIMNHSRRMIHRWRYALILSGYEGMEFLKTRTPDGATVFFCGDAFCGARVEGAYLSGLATGKSIATESHQTSESAQGKSAA